MVTNELSLFPAWISAPWSICALLEGLKDGLVALMFSTQALYLKRSFPGSVNLAKLQQISLQWLYKDYFLQPLIPALSSQQQLWNSTYELKNRSSIDRTASAVKEHRQILGAFLLFSSFITVELCNMLLWSRCGYLKPVSAASSLSP